MPSLTTEPHKRPNSIQTQPTFKLKNLQIGQRHQVRCTHIDDGPKLFSICAKSSEQNLAKMMSALNNYTLNALSRQPTIGMACVARYSVDQQLYRAVIMNISTTHCLVAYIDYGYHAEVTANDLFDIPSEFMHNSICSMYFSLAGWSGTKDESLRATVDKYFGALVKHQQGQLLELVAKPLDGPYFVQYCDLYVNGTSVVEKLLDVVKRQEKFTQSDTLQQDELVVVRYVKSPAKFYVQRSNQLVAYRQMMQSLMRHCESAPPLKRLEAGAVCALAYGSDKNCYRAELINVADDKQMALVQIVDYGIMIGTCVAALRSIAPEMLLLPRQAIECCLDGFREDGSAAAGAYQLALLGEDAVGMQRHFKVKITHLSHPRLVLNLIDDSASPIFDMAARMLQLVRKSKKFDNFEQADDDVGEPQQQRAQSPLNQSDRIIFNGAEGEEEGGEEERQINWMQPQQQGNDSSSTMSYRWNSSPKRTLSSSPHARSTRLKAVNASPQNTDTSGHCSWDNSSESCYISAALPIPLRLQLNKRTPVLFSWWISPFEFYVRNKDKDEVYAQMMEQMQTFYSSAQPTNSTSISIGSYVVYRNPKDTIFYRALVDSYSGDFTERYKLRLCDVGRCVVVQNRDFWRLEQQFSTVEPLAIRCSMPRIVSDSNRTESNCLIQYIKSLNQKIMMCTYLEYDGADTYYVCLEANGLSIRDHFIKDGFLTELSDEIEMSRLVGQIISITIEASPPSHGSSPFCAYLFGRDHLNCMFKWKNPHDDYQSVTGAGLQSVPVYIDELSNDNILIVSPVLPLELYWQMTDYPIIRNNFHVEVSHIELPNVVYIQNIKNSKQLDQLQSDLFNSYEIKNEGNYCSEFTPNRLCVAKSDTDGYWYRCRIESTNEDGSILLLRKIDFGTCESASRSNCRELLQRYGGTLSALALRAYLPFAVNVATEPQFYIELNALTQGCMLDVKVLEYYRDHWIVDISVDNVSLGDTLCAKNLCRPLEASKIQSQIDQEFDSENISRMSTFLQQRQQQQLQATDVQSLASCRVTFISSINEFYVLMTKDSDLLLAICNRLMKDDSIGCPLSEYIEHKICAAKCDEDGCWYRAKIIKYSVGRTKVKFIDYGRTATVTECKELLDTSISKLPALSKCYALRMPENIRHWNGEAEQRFRNIAPDTEFLFRLISKESERSIVDLTYDGRNLSEELAKLCTTTVVSGHVTWSISARNFFVQPQKTRKKSDEIFEELMACAAQYPPLKNCTVGTLCVARYDADQLFYRALIKGVTNEKKYQVLFVDYGNMATATDLRTLPVHLGGILPSIVNYSLQSVSGAAQPIDEAPFIRSVFPPNANIYHFQVIDSSVTPTVVRMFTNCECTNEVLATSSIDSGITHSAVNAPTPLIGSIYHVNSSNDFYFQPLCQAVNLSAINTELNMYPNTLPTVPKPEINSLYAAVHSADGMFYRAKLIEILPTTFRVYFIDYGNVGESADVRSLPVRLLEIGPCCQQCALVVSDNRCDDGPILMSESEFKSSMPTMTRVYAKVVDAENCPNLIRLFRDVDCHDEIQVAHQPECSVIDGSIIWCSSSRDFYVQANEHHELLRKIFDSLNSVSDEVRPWRQNDGRLGSALYEGSYYRAKCLRKCSKGYEVYFVDHGNRETVSELREIIDDEIASVPPLAVHMALSEQPHRSDAGPVISEHDFRNLCLALNGKSINFQIVDGTQSPKRVRMFSSNSEVLVGK